MSIEFVDNCEFCSLQKNEVLLPSYLQNPCTSNVGQIYQAILCNTKHFYVKTDISPVTEGHLLVIPKTHIFCMATIPSAYEDEFEEILHNIERFYYRKGANCLFFEHGCCNEKEPGSSCIHHAHLHAIPVSPTDEKTIIIEACKKLGTPLFSKSLVMDTGYLYLKTTCMNKAFYWKDEVKQSQFFRILISKTIGDIRRSRWQNCIVDEHERNVSAEWARYFVDAVFD